MYFSQRGQSQNNQDCWLDILGYSNLGIYNLFPKSET